MEQPTPLCPVCWQRFDVDQCLPKILPLCGHTLCLKCLRNIIENNNPRCPLDKKMIDGDIDDLDTFPTNYLARELLEQESMWSSCPDHQEEKCKLICLEDQTKICSYCVIFGSCKGHQVKPIAELKPKFEEKAKELEEFMNELDTTHKKMFQFLNERRSKLRTTVRDTFQEINHNIKMKELELSVELSSFFDNQISRLHSFFGKGSNIHNNISSKLSSFTNFAKGKDNLFKLLEEDVSNFAKEIKDKVMDFVPILKKDLEKVSTLLNETMHKVNKNFISTEIQSFIEMINSKEHESNQDLLNQNPLPDLIPLRFETDFKITDVDHCVKIDSYKGNSKKVFELTSKETDKFKELQFEIDFKDFTEENLIQVACLQRKLNNLKAIQIKAENNSRTFLDKYLLFLSSVFWRPENLESIHISLLNSEYKDFGVMHLFKEVLPKIPNLKTLYLKLYGTKITDESLIVLINRSLPVLNTLESFSLIISEAIVTEEVIIQLFQSLPDVKHLLLGLGSISLTDKALEIFSNLLPKFSKLESLELGVWKNALSENSIQLLLNNLPIVKSLKLGFRATGVTDKNMEFLLESKLPLMTSLREFDLNCDDTNVTDEIKTLIKLKKEAIRELD